MTPPQKKRGANAGLVESGVDSHTKRRVVFSKLEDRVELCGAVFASVDGHSV